MTSQLEYAVPYLKVGTIIDDRDVAAIREVLQSGATLSQGSLREQFEAAFRQHIGTRYAISVSSGTVALELAIHLLNLQPGDEVITTPQTYQASIQPLLGRQVTVRFADIAAGSPNIDPTRVAELVTCRTRAVIVVHYGGLPVDMDPLMSIARDHSLLVIEDAAHALGSMYRGRRPGSIGDIGCFSFHSSKNITTLGEGGMITLNRSDWAERVRSLRSNEADMVLVKREEGSRDSIAPVPQALYPGNAYTHECRSILRHGTNATLSEAAAAMGVVQLGKLPDLVARRQMIAARIRAELAKYDCARLPAEPADVIYPYHLFTFSVDAGKVDRDELVRQLMVERIETFLRYFPLHLLPEWRAQGHHRDECPRAERSWFAEHMNLPCHPGLSDDQVDVLVAGLSRAILKARLSPRSSRDRSFPRSLRGHSGMF
jgi:perosamine synthetase